MIHNDVQLDTIVNNVALRAGFARTDFLGQLDKSVPMYLVVEHGQHLSAISLRIEGHMNPRISSTE